MLDRCLTAAAVAAAALAAGCYQEAARPSDQATTAISTPSIDDAKPVAEAFLRAVLAGDDASAARLLTPAAARRHEAEPGMFSGVGLAVERLEVSEARRLSEWEAAVACLVAEKGATQPVELGCLLKHGATGWRVCGMASESATGQPMLVNFEEPASAPVVPPGLVENGSAETPRTAASAAPTTSESPARSVRPRPGGTVPARARP